MIRHSRYFYCFLVVMTFWVQFAFAQTYTRGVGIYPGRVQEAYVPMLVQDDTYRNIALHRKAYHSSSYDYNLTAQLLTDGIITRQGPAYLVASTNSGVLPLREREWAIDGGEYTRNILMGSGAKLEYHWQGMGIKANQVKLFASVAYQPEVAKNGFSIKVMGKNRKGQWVVLDEKRGKALPGEASRYKAHSDPNKNTGGDLLPTRKVNISFNLNTKGKTFTDFRLALDMDGAAYWTVTELKFYQDGRPMTDLLPSSAFNSCWMSAGGGNQWVYVDLGVKASFDKIRLHWVQKALQGQLEVSDDAQRWRPLCKLSSKNVTLDEYDSKATARYVRVNMQGARAGQRYAISELEVMGRGGLVAHPKAESRPDGNQLSLNGGRWRLQRASQVRATGEQIAQAAFDDSQWITATVPATVLSSYMNIGAIPNPNYADNLFMISESFFNSNFWYRRSFHVPQAMLGKHVFLNFDGINWKADIYLNGKKIDRMEGAFVRGRIEVSKLLVAGENVLAVEIVKNQHPGAVKQKNEMNTDFNGGILGYDNPTFHATIGWDWISTIRGRDIGIWNDVYLSAEGGVSLADPVVTSCLNLPDTLATVTPSVVLKNNESHAVTGRLKGWIGEVMFEKTVTLPASATVEAAFDPSKFAVLKNRRLRLWWPNGYGTPYLYDAGFKFEVDGNVSDELTFKAGIREMGYRDVDTRLTMYVNGKRFVPLGGNWGFSESNLNYRGREYDIAVKYHRDMNYNMIRNWVGQTGDEEFYEACDRYGIMVWQDFWLANPADGPDPMDEDMFLKNAKDYVYRIRKHPSIGLYCGRNEGYPPETIDRALRQFVQTLHPGLCYVSSSADDGISGHGPYRALSAKEYFEKQTGKLHSERGMPNVMTFEGLSRTLSPAALWPQNAQWGQHDYTLQGAQQGDSFNKIIEKAFGKVQNAKQFTALAQWVNYEGYRAMYESGSKDRLGLLIWMSHSCWPSMTWQTYDYYFEPTAAFFGVKKACEPLHIQWNASTRNMEVVNLNKVVSGTLRAQCEVLDIHGTRLSYHEMVLQSKPDTTVVCTKIEEPDMPGTVYFLKMKLVDDNNQVLSDNFYVCSTDEGNLQELRLLPMVTLTTNVKWEGTQATVVLRNERDTPAMMNRINLKGNDGLQILPVDYSDNYFHLMPGEQKTVTVKWKKEDTRGCEPMLEISGLNVNLKKMSVR